MSAATTTNTAVTALAASSFPSFVQSDSCVPVIEQLLAEENLTTLVTRSDLLWSE